MGRKRVFIDGQWQSLDEDNGSMLVAIEYGGEPAWSPLRETAVVADETLESDAVVDEVFPSEGHFVSLKFDGTLTDEATMDVTVVEVVDDVAFPVIQAFPDGSTTLTLTRPCVINLVKATGNVAVMLDGKQGSPSVTVEVRKAA